jgi:diguanylate cyclase (GGDEF)-like protein
MNNLEGKRSRLTIGFYSDHPEYESEANIIRGAMEAAEQADVNFIYIGQLGDDENDPIHSNNPTVVCQRKLDKLKVLVEMLQLDGLLILGWGTDYQGDGAEAFRKRFQNLPVVSLGHAHDPFPSVFVDGYPYVKELTLHLANAHSCKHIAIIESWSNDVRVDAYASALKEAGLSSDGLIVTRDGDLAGIDDVYYRICKAVDILLNERRLPVDAILTMTSTEGKMVLDYLNKRGIRVPGQIAVVCYEDHTSHEFTSPPMTCIYYPFKELGFVGGQNLIRLIQGEDIPHFQKVPAHHIYRDSCGCTMNNIKPVQFDRQSQAELAGSEHGDLNKAAAALSRKLPNVQIHYAMLAEAYIEAVITGRASLFMAPLEQELRNVQLKRGKVNAQEMLDAFFLALLPFIPQDPDALVRAEEVLFAARYVALERKHGENIHDYIRQEELNFATSYIGKALLSSYTMPKIFEVINNHTGWLQISTNYIFMLEEKQSSIDQCRLAFSFHDYQIMMDEYEPNMYMKDAFATFKRLKNGRFSLTVFPLHVNEDLIGVCWMDPGPNLSTTLITMVGYISTAIKGSRLLEASETLVRNLCSEIQLRKEKEAELAYLADTDVLTGLYNRRFFHDAIENAVQIGKSFSVFFIDIDGFKPVNDTFGHDTGDALLVQITERIVYVLKQRTYPLIHKGDYDKLNTDAIFRLGGDEFTVMLAETRPEKLSGIAIQLTEKIRAPYEVEGKVVHISCSIGISRFPDDSTDDLRLLKHADTAMYKAKLSKNAFVFFADIRKEGDRVCD